MVSIPDWSRLQRLGDFPTKETTSPRSRYYKQREQEAIKQAEEQGYFLNPSRSFLEQQFLPDDDEENDVLNVWHRGDNEKKEKDLSQIFLMNLPLSRLKSVGDIGLCSNLTICILGNNYISRFDSLVGCPFLMKLDLQSNQISTLPGPTFWAALPFLKFLHLHDNPIGNIENLQCLSSCQSLTVLTMYDTPLSLKKNYRHHAVNSMWALKALDNFVISDEEIIEDAEFEERFTALHPAFGIELCPQNYEETTYEVEIAKMNQILVQINTIMAHNSPVLIVQRYIRGYLARKTRGISWRRHDNTDNLTDTMSRDDESKPPPASPVSSVQADVGTIPVDRASMVGDSLKMDYDTYMMNRRPGSTAAGSDGSLLNTSRYAMDASNSRAPSSVVERRKKKNIFINLTKLHSGTLQGLSDAASAMEREMTTTEGSFIREDRPSPPGTRRGQKRWRDERVEKPKRRIIRDIKQFFGPMVDAVASAEPTYEDREDVPIINFRLKGLKQKICLTDPTMDMIIARKEIGQDIRIAEDEYHTHVDNIPRPCIKREPTMTTDQRLFNKVHGTMGLSCLNAIQQAYKDRDRIEQKSAKMEYVLSMKEQREAAKQRIKLYKEDQRNKTLHQRAGDHKKMVETLEKRNFLQMSYLDRRGEHRSRTSLVSRERRRELTFVQDFNIQNTSVSNALLRHDRQAKSEDRMQSSTALVNSYKAAEKEQQEIVKKYMEHRTLMRQTESAMSRATMDTRMLQEANDRIMQARARVAHQKARSVNVTAALPASTTPTLPPVIRPNALGLQRWNTDIPMPVSAMPPGPVVKSKVIPTSVI